MQAFSLNLLAFWHKLPYHVLRVIGEINLKKFSPIANAA
jgi:hypothetical protein